MPHRAEQVLHYAHKCYEILLIRKDAEKLNPKPIHIFNWHMAVKKVVYH